MKILKEDLTISREVYKFLEDNMILVNKLKFDELFEKAEKAIYSYRVSLYKLIYKKFPACLNYMTIIPENFFKESDISSIIIPNNIKEVRHSAFRDCKNLKSVDIQSNDIQWSSYVFSGCSSLDTIDLNKIKHFPYYMFENTGLKNIVVNTSVEDFGTFRNCLKLETVELNSNQTDLGSYTFAGCSRLKKVKLSDTIDKLGNDLFEDCISLSEIKLPNDLKYVNHDVFNNTSIEELIFPNSTIEINILGSMPKLINIKLPDKLKYINLLSFDEIPNLKELRIPVKFRNAIEFMVWQKSKTLRDYINMRKITYPIIFKDKIFNNGKELYNLLESSIKKQKTTIPTLYKITDGVSTLVTTGNSKQIPVNVGFRSNQGLTYATGPVFFTSKEDAEKFIENFNTLGKDQLGSSCIITARLQSKDYIEGFDKVKTVCGQCLLQRNKSAYLNSACIVKKNVFNN